MLRCAESRRSAGDQKLPLRSEILCPLADFAKYQVTHNLYFIDGARRRDLKGLDSQPLWARLATILVLMTGLLPFQSARSADTPSAEIKWTYFRLSLDKAGHIASCEITTSSGDAKADAWACKFMKYRARFYPPHRKGEALASVFTNRIRYEKSRDTKINFEKRGDSKNPMVDLIVETNAIYPNVLPRYLTTNVLISPDGQVEECAVSESSGEKSIDALACGALRKNGARPAVDVDNNPVRSVWLMKVMVRSKSVPK